MYGGYGADMDFEHRGDQRMSLTHLLADAVQADREREIRARSPRLLGLSSGPRHPQGSAGATTPDARPAKQKPAALPRWAWGR